MFTLVSVMLRIDWSLSYVTSFWKKENDKKIRFLLSYNSISRKIIYVLKLHVLKLFLFSFMKLQHTMTHVIIKCCKRFEFRIQCQNRSKVIPDSRHVRILIQIKISVIYRAYKVWENCAALKGLSVSRVRGYEWLGLSGNRIGFAVIK